MKLSCEIEVAYTLAMAAGGGVPSRSSRSRASVCLGKKPAPRLPGCKEGSGTTAQQGREREELYLIVSTAKNVDGSKYKVGVVSTQ